MQRDWAEELRLAGLKVTAPRLAVIEALTQTPHADADCLVEEARKALGSLSTQAVYDNLHALVQKGIVRRIQPAGHPARYELRVGDNHHHIICRSCGKTTDVDCAVGAAPCLDPSHTHGFKIDEAEVIFWGLCAPCQTQKEENQP